MTHQDRQVAAHRPPRDQQRRRERLKERYAQLGPAAGKFLDGLLQSQRNGWQQAEKVLALLATYRPADFQAALARAVRYGAFSLSAVQRILAVQAQPKSCLEQLAQQRRQRAVERRLHDAYFREVKRWEDFDWKFNAATIDRAQIEQLASGEFVRRGDNLVFVGQSGVGKSHLVQALGRQCCVLGYHVRYTTSAKLLQDLTAALADQTLPARLSYWTRFEWLIIDEFGFDRLERTLSPQAANLLYKVIDGRSPQRSTGLVTNIDFESWADYLGDPPLAMAFLDRVVDGAILLKVQGRSYRAQRAQRPTPPPSETPS